MSLLLVTATLGFAANLSLTPGCSAVPSSGTINSVKHWAALRKGLGAIAYHAAVSVSTDKGDFSFAYSNTIPDSWVSPGALYCQAGQPPFSNYFANGDTKDDGWFVTDTQSPDKDNSLSGLKKQVDGWAAAHPTYSLAACEVGACNIVANCQCTASWLFHHVSGHYPKLHSGMDTNCYK